MPRPYPEGDDAPSTSDALELASEGDDVELSDIRIRAPPATWTTTASVSCVVAWGALAIHNLVMMPRLDGVEPVTFDRVTGTTRFGSRYALFALRLGTFLFGVFFLCYHLIYEESKKHTDGMEYLSDWTILFLCATEGALAFSMFRTEKEPGALTALTNRLVIAYGVSWSLNLVSSAGAWYSFFAFPMCQQLEGVDNYPDCYLEWYRLAEHAGNLVVLLLELLLGAMPMRRRDFGWSILFMEVYVLFCWFRYVFHGVIVYEMFDFSLGMEALAWYNVAFFGTALAFFISLKLHQPKGYRTNGRAGIFTYETVDGERASLVSGGR